MRGGEHLSARTVAGADQRHRIRRRTSASNQGETLAEGGRSPIEGTPMGGAGYLDQPHRDTGYLGKGCALRGAAQQRH